jgi:phenylacetate-CoA ligase
LFAEIGFKPEDIRTLEDIKQIPPLNREDVVERRHEMVDRRFQESIPLADQSTLGPGQPIAFARFRRHKLVKNTSAGSTGIPTVFYEDGSTTAWNWAHELRLKAWFGCTPGGREARFARLSTDYLPSSRTLRMRKRLWHQLILPGVDLTDEIYELCLQKTREYRPKLIYGFTTALTGFADYLQRTGQGILPVRPRVVTTWAAPLYAHEDYLLKQVFDCPVTNIYGSREVGHVAGLCPHGTMHVNQERYYVEVNGDSPGELLVTPLFVTPMPFIRYRIGDIGAIGGSECPCGRHHQVLSELLGRNAEVFVTQDGHMIAPNFWCRTFMGDGPSRNIEKFQVVYRKDGSVHVRIIRRENYGDEVEEYLRNSLKKSFGSTPFEFEYVSRIDPLPSGKYQMVIREESASSQ